MLQYNPKEKLERIQCFMPTDSFNSTNLGISLDCSPLFILYTVKAFQMICQHDIKHSTCIVSIIKTKIINMTLKLFI